VAYFGVLWICRAERGEARKWRLTLTLMLLFVPLIFFKYSNFFYGDVIGAFSGDHAALFNLSLPLGVSFITFTLTAYVVDSYRGQFPPDTPPLTVLAYVLFFPHLIAGPILRPVELMPQLSHPGRAKYLRPTAAVALFSVGLVKKLVFADQLASTVDAAYSHSQGLSAPEALLAIYAFSAQIYCDFSGYTDMAIGLAMLLGVRLPNNFSRPYGASSIIDFWRRWHRTLSFWLRDYLYIPLGGNRGGRLVEVRNIVITMALGGLWHGANWTFVIWGLMHGAMVSGLHIVRRFSGGALEHIPRWVAVLLTFHVVTLAWVFFRAPHLDQATHMLAAAAFGSWARAHEYFAAHAFDVLLLVLFLTLHRFDDHRRLRIAAVRLPPEILWPALVGLWVLAIAVSHGGSAKFIYFDF
jgi:alginate O-acetyltransferase complex protein AlgI